MKNISAVDPKTKVKQLITDLQMDIADYRMLLEILKEQQKLLSAHNNEALIELHKNQLPIMHRLSLRANLRRRLLTELGFDPDSKGMQLLLQKLPAPSSKKSLQLWQELEQLLIASKTQNDINGRLLAGQMEVIKTLLQQSSDYQAPFSF